MKLSMLNKSKKLYAIERQSSFWQYLDMISIIYKDNRLDLLTKCIDCFSYGYMVGRASLRAEKNKEV